jgi:replicative DNA helicase
LGRSPHQKTNFRGHKWIIKLLPPSSIEAEEEILGGILFDSKAMVIAKDLLPIASAFYVSAHEIIYQAFLNLDKENKSTDFITVSTYLSDRDLLEKIGGTTKLSKLLNRTVSAVNIDRYCKLVLDKSISRNLIKAGHQIVDFGYDQTETVEQSIAQSQRKLEEVAKQKFFSEMEDHEDLSMDAFEDLGEIKPIYKTGLTDLDKMMIGFEPGTLTVVAGRPSMGKSAAGLFFAFKHLIQYELPVAFFSLEMTSKQLEYRLWSQISVHSFFLLPTQSKFY